MRDKGSSTAGVYVWLEPSPAKALGAMATGPAGAAARTKELRALSPKAHRALRNVRCKGAWALVKAGIAVSQVGIRGVAGVEKLTSLWTDRLQTFPSKWHANRRSVIGF